jgi:hypothetical protein
MRKAQNSRPRVVRIVATLTIAVALLPWCWSPALAAGGAYDIAAYKALADADSSQGIPQGTAISVENWQNYKQFLPIGLQWLYSGR